MFGILRPKVRVVLDDLINRHVSSHHVDHSGRTELLWHLPPCCTIAWWRWLGPPDRGAANCLQNNHKRGLAVVTEEVLDLEEVLARRRAKQATAATAPLAGLPAGRGPQIVQKPDSPGQEMPPIPDPAILRGRREEETYGNGPASAKKRPPGAETTAIPKNVG